MAEASKATIDLRPFLDGRVNAEVHAKDAARNREMVFMIADKIVIEWIWIDGEGKRRRTTKIFRRKNKRNPFLDRMSHQSTSVDATLAS